MARYPFQRLSLTNAPIAAQLKEAAARVIDSGWYLHGSEVSTLEEKMAEITGAKYAVAVGCGLDAIRLIFDAYIHLGRLKRGDAVAVPANTFIASVLPLTELGLKVIPVEPHPTHYATDFLEMIRAVDEHPEIKAILPVHLYGNPLWDYEIAEILRNRGILIVEDACQAIGTAGSLGAAAAFSFYPGKNIGALGDGGMVTTSDKALAETVSTLANYGSNEKYHHRLRGYNSRLDELQAAFLNIKLAGLQQENDRRRAVAAVYRENISHPLIKVPEDAPGHVWHQFVIATPYRESLQRYLTDHGVETMIHYPIPVHKQECYRDEFTGVSLPLSERMANEVLSLPIANASEQDAYEISQIINQFHAGEEEI